MKFTYHEIPFETRKEEILKIIIKYPDRVPVYLQSTSKDITILKNKLLVDKSHTVGQLMYSIRSKLCITSDKAIFLSDESGHMPMTSQLVSELYRAKKNLDGCMYLWVSVESTFG